MDRAAGGWTLSLVSALAAQQSRFPQGIAEQARKAAQRSLHSLRKDWHGARYLSFGLILYVLSSLVVAAYYLNHPTPETNPDTPSYLSAVQHILANGQFVDPIRTPGFPLLIAIVYLLAGQGNLMAVSVVQGILFVLATLELYVLACMILRRSWIALVVGLLMVTNTYLLSYIKPVIIEGTSLWLVVSLALTVVLFVHSLRRRDLWLVAVFTLLLFMTRPEWIYLPVLLFAYLLVIAARRGVLRRLLPHGIAAVLLLYSVLGLYIYLNATESGLVGVTAVQNINLLGKVMQYHMQNEAPPQYAAVAQVVNTFVERGDANPYDVVRQYPALADHYWSLAGSYATSIIVHHPIEFLFDSVPVFLTLPYFYYPYSSINPQGPLAFPLLKLQTLSVALYPVYALFPILALLWVALLFWRRTSRLRSVEAMGAVVLLALYSLALTTLGAYGEYMRFRAPVDPLLLLVVWGTLMVALVRAVPLLDGQPVVGQPLAWLWPGILWVWSIGLFGGLLLGAGISAFLHGPSVLVHPSTWVGIHWFFDHPTRAGLLVLLALLAALLTYYAYRAHRLRAAAPDGAKQGKNQSQAIIPRRVRSALEATSNAVRRCAQQLGASLRSDWHKSRYWSFGIILLVTTSLVVAAFYLNHPQVEIDPDTQSYLTVAQHILADGRFVDPIRTPGYPSFIALVYLLAGQGNLAAVSVGQGILFVVATLEVYIITCLIMRRAWMGLIVGLIVGTNTYLLGFVKPDIAEGFGLWVVVSLALAVTLFLLTLRARLLWLVAAFILLAFMTHPEWIYAPVPIFAYLLIFAWRRGKLRRLLPHAVAAVLVLYGCLGLFVYVNTTQNGYPGITDVQGINLLGKVIEYNMQDEAPAQYAIVTQKLDAYLAAGGERSPYAFANYYPPIEANYWALADAYASSIVYHHPIEFFLDTIPIIVNSSNFYYAYSGISAKGAFSSPLAWLEQISSRVYFFYRFFPLFALLWLGLLFWRPTRRVQVMGALSLLGLYELAIVAAGGYSDFTRLHVPFDPIMLVVIWGSLLLCVQPLLSLFRKSPLNKPLARLWPVIPWAWGIIIVGGLVLSAAVTVLRHGLAPLAHPTTWTGLHSVFDHPLWTLALLGVGAVLSRLAYLGYQEQQALLAPTAPASDQAREEPAPQMETALEQGLEAEHLP